MAQNLACRLAPISRIVVLLVLAPILTVAPTGTARAQSTVLADPWTGVEEMVVTGDGSLATLIEQPSSVIAFDTEEILAKGIGDVGDLAEFTPNLEIQSAFAASSPELFVRGVGLRDSNSNAASAVAVISDGVYFNSATGQLAQLFDVRNVSVLRGPQGTQYGRNASAGVILIESNRPSGEFGSRLNFTYGRFNQVDVEGYIETPIVPELLSIRVAGKLSRRDPLGRNGCGGGPPFPVMQSPQQTLGSAFIVGCDASRAELALDGITFPQPGAPLFDSPERRINDRENWAARGQLLFRPREELTVLFNAHGGQNRSLAPSFQHLGLIEPVDPPETSRRRLGRNLYRDAESFFDPDRCQIFDATGTQCLKNSFNDEDRGDPFSGQYNFTPPEDLDLFGTFLRVEYGAENWSLTSVTSYEYADRVAGLDLDASPWLRSERLVSDEAWQFMQDLRLGWNAGGRLDLTLGLFLLHAEIEASNFFRTKPTGTFSQLGQVFEESTDYLGLFGVSRFELSELFSVELGIRLNVERKDFFIEAQNFTIQNDAIRAASQAGQGILLANVESLDVVPSGDVVFEYHATEDIDVYLKFVRGYKGRHFNAGGTNDQTPVNPADPEYVNSFEAGYSARFFEGILSWNTAMFLYLYEDQQVFQIRTREGSPPINELINAEDSRIFGIESDFRVDWEGLHVFGAFGWTQAEYSDFVNALRFTSPDNEGRPLTRVQIQDFSGSRLVLAPEFSFSGGVYYDWQIGRVGTLTPRFDFSFKDRVFTTPSNSPVLGDNERWLFDVRIDYREPNGKFSIGFWVRNLTDEIYRATVVGGAAGRAAVAVADPRTYGVSTTVSF